MTRSRRANKPTVHRKSRKIKQTNRQYTGNQGKSSKQTDSTQEIKENQANKPTVHRKSRKIKQTHRQYIGNQGKSKKTVPSSPTRCL